ncbi:helix-turn-helix domain-containing protein [Phormidium tenue FACHB-886]|nr:helix-turn-helix domain-containing protein [Phormidium tenue FACHB-886]
MNDAQAQLLEQFLALPLLSPDDFVARWTLSYRQISQICRCSTSTVEHWFSDGAGRRSPAPCYQKLLAVADFLLTNSDFFHVWRQLWE